MSFLKNIGLTALASFLIYILMNWGPYKEWWEFRIKSVYDQKQEFGDITDVEQRMHMRFPELAFYQNIKKYIAEQGDSTPVILLPPKGLMQQNNINQFNIAEPVVFYYFTGLKSYWANMKDAQKSTWALTIENGGFNVVKLNDSLRHALITEYNKYEISL